MSTLTFKMVLTGNNSTNTKRIHIIGTNLQIDYGDGTTTIQEPNTERIDENHTWTRPDGVSSFTWNITITGDIVGLGEYFLNSGRYIEEINLPEGLRIIEYGALMLTYIKEIVIPSTVTSIGGNFLANSLVEKVIMLTKNFTSMDSQFLYNCTHLKSINLPEGLKTLGSGSFYNCTSLKKLELPSTLTSIVGSVAFQNVELETLKFNGGPISRPPINENTKIIVRLNRLQDFINHSSYPDERGRYGFFGETLAEKIYILGIVLAEGLSDKDVLANANEGLKPLANKILDIGGTEYRNLIYEIDWDDNDNEFELRPSQLPVLLLANGEVVDGCILSQDNNYFYQTSVHKYDVNNEEIIYTWQLLENVKQYYKQEVDINQNTHKTIMTLTPLMLTYRGGEFSSYNNTPFSFSDALNIDWDDDTTSTYNGGILTHTFDDNSIDHTIAIKGDLTALNDNCFLDCVGLISATLSDNITRFGTSCFRNCSKLENINIPNNITSLEQYCFDGCSSLTDINIPDSVTNIKYSCFRGCSSLTSITIPDSITALEGNCFQSCTNLTNVTLPNTFTTLGQCSFQFCDHLVQINLPNTLTSTATNCFMGCSRLTNITLPNTLTNLAYGTFSGAGLTTISIPSGVTNIGAYCFSDCNGLSEIVIPEATTNIGIRCFYYCRNLHNIIFKGEVPPTIGNYCFDGVTATITVPYGSLSAYEAALSGKGGNLTIIEDYETPL